MIDVKVEVWKNQSPGLLGLISDKRGLFKLEDKEKREQVTKWISLLKENQKKKEICQNGLWVSCIDSKTSRTRDEQIRSLAAKCYSSAKKDSAPDLGFLLNAPEGVTALPWVVQGIMLGSYRFDKYKSSEGKRPQPQVTLYVKREKFSATKKAVSAEMDVLACVRECRDLVNEPANAAYPGVIAEQAKAMAENAELDCEIIPFADLQKKEYQGLINVGKGSQRQPCMVILRYKPKRKAKSHLALVGKGITFDSGGYCLKPGKDMWEMKCDMAGAATVLGAMHAIAKRRPPVRVTGILCLAENMISCKSYRPGDIFKAKNGKSVHVLNTDAEGRLVLTDGLYRAGEEGATHIVDLATLTGACIVALGMNVTGLFANQDGFKRQLFKAARGTGELFWELPLHEEYAEHLKSPYADIANIGTRDGGTIQSALFLKEFVPENTAWIHLDIAGPAFTPKKWKYLAEGATGIGVRTLVNLAEGMK